MNTIAIHPTYVAVPAADSTRTASSRPAQVQESDGHLRLTRRGRAVVLALGLLAVFGAFVFTGAGSVATQEQGEPVRTELHTVAAGETLWQIAGDIETGETTGALVDRIEEMNGLESASLSVGQELRLPVGE